MKPVVAFGALVALQGCGDEEPKATSPEIDQDGELQQQLQEHVEGAVDTVMEEVKKVVSASKLQSITDVQQKVKDVIADLDVEHLAEEHKDDLETIKTAINDGLAQFQGEISHQDWNKKLGEMQTLLTNEVQKFDTDKLEATVADTFEQAQKAFADHMQVILPMNKQKATETMDAFMKDPKAKVAKEHFEAVMVLAELPAADTKDVRQQFFKEQKPLIFRSGRKTYKTVEEFQKAYKTTTKEGNTKLTPFNQVISTDTVQLVVAKAICTEAQTADESEIAKISHQDFCKFVNGFMPVIKEPAVKAGKKVESKKEEAPKEEAPKEGEAPKEDSSKGKKSKKDKKSSKESSKGKKSKKDKKTTK
jgi:hypothetical protein